MTRAAPLVCLVSSVIALGLGCSDSSPSVNNNNDNSNDNNAFVCGNGVREGTEECDGDDLGGASCQGLGYASGTLTCYLYCKLNTAQCQVEQVCGDGVATGDEECDGSDLRGQSCQSLYGLAGTLACDSQCHYGDGDCRSPDDGFCDIAAGENQLDNPGDCGFSVVSVGGGVTCGVRNDQSLWCWGENKFGQLGIGTVDPSPVTVPMRVLGPSKVLAVAASHGSMYLGDHSCAIAEDRTVWCWGSNYAGQLGQGVIFPQSATPLQVVGLANAERIAVGGPQTCAVDLSSDLYCWGGNSFGELGIGSFDATTVPTLVDTLSGVTSISANMDYYGNHTCAVSHGDIYCWGSNRDFVLGLDWPYSPYDLVSVPTLQKQQDWQCFGFAQVSCGFEHGCGATTSGVLCCWGNNYEEQTTASPDPPAFQVPPDAVTAYAGHWRAVAAANGFTCGRLDSGEVACYGMNDRGMLGLGFTSEHEGASPVPGLSQVVSISSGAYTSCAILADSTLWCWGSNQWGQLGDGSTTDSATPVPVAY